MVLSVVAVFLMLFGLVNITWAYELARFETALGDSRRTHNVEPADWNVKATRLMGFVSLFVGTAFLFASLT